MLLMRLSGGDEKNETNRFIVCLGAVIRRGRVGVDVDVTKWLWAVCGCSWFENGRGINFCHCCCVPPMANPYHTSSNIAVNNVLNSPTTTRR